MTRRDLTRTGLALLLATASTIAAGWAQENPRPEPTPQSPRKVTATLRVQLVITRYQNEKKEASLPYTLIVSAVPNGAPQPRVRMRMGVDTPIPITSFTVSDESDPKKQKPPAPTSYQYRNVGTNVDCGAEDLGDGRYQLHLSVENSSALPPPQSAGANAVPVSAPVFRRFDTSFDPVIRDGQTLQTIASTDPVTGEVVKIDVSLTVLK